MGRLYRFLLHFAICKRLLFAVFLQIIPACLRVYAKIRPRFRQLGEFMASRSKYQSSQVDALLQDIIIVLEKYQAPVDLSLMALGNAVSNILANHIKSSEQRAFMAKAFAEALKNSLK